MMCMKRRYLENFEYLTDLKDELKKLQQKGIRKLIKNGEFEEVENICKGIKYDKIMKYANAIKKLSPNAEHFDFEIDPKKRGYLLRAEDVPKALQIEMIVLIFHFEFEAELLFGEANWARFIDSISKNIEIDPIISENLKKAKIHSYRDLEHLFTQQEEEEKK